MHLVRAVFGLVLACSTIAALAASDDWPQFQRTPARAGRNPVESSFTAADVSTLAIAWNGDFGASVATEGGAVIAGGRLFTTGYDGRLSAFALAGCGAATCTPAWQGRTRNDITSTPAVVGDTVYVASADHFVHAFDVAGCGAALCDARWRGRLPASSLDSSVAVAGGRVYVGDYSGRLSVFDAAGCGAALCDPMWTAQAGPHEQLNSAPAVGAGFVYIQTTYQTSQDSTGRLLAFPAAGCGASTCAAAWSADLGGPAGRSSSPLVAGDRVYVGSSRRFGGPNGPDHLFSFAAAGCGQATCTPLQVLDVGEDGIETTPVIAGHWLFASTQATPNPNTVGVVAAFDLAHCGARCGPTWTGVNFTDGFLSPPAVAGDVVFVGKGPALEVDAGVFAYDARGCGGQRTCRALTLVRPSDSGNFMGAPLAIGQGRIAFVSNDNTDGRAKVSVMSIPLP